MKVHLIKTPDYPIENFIEVIDILRSFNGPLEFMSSSQEFNKEDFYFLTGSDGDYSFPESNSKMAYKVSQGIPLSWKELFSLCDYYRDFHGIPPNEFVILLTEKNNSLNWFSMFELNRNAFVHCGDWELFTDAPSQYPIAYEVVANVLRCSMKPEMELPAPYFHSESIGCMNDLCVDKKAVLLKLKTGDICKDCHEKLLEENTDEKIIDQAFNIFEGIRSQLLFRQGLKRKVKLSMITLNERRRLTFNELGNLELKLFPLPKTLYVFYLLHPEGVRLNELNDYKPELLNLYRKFSVSDSGVDIISRIDDLVDPHGGSFSQKKSQLNKIIKNLLGDTLAQHYRIEGEPGERFKINLPEHLVKIELAGVGDNFSII